MKRPAGPDCGTYRWRRGMAEVVRGEGVCGSSGRLFWPLAGSSWWGHDGEPTRLSVVPDSR